jgi:hypothetical protein
MGNAVLCGGDSKYHDDYYRQQCAEAGRQRLKPPDSGQKHAGTTVFEWSPGFNFLSS